MADKAKHGWGFKLPPASGYAMVICEAIPIIFMQEMPEANFCRGTGGRRTMTASHKSFNQKKSLFPV
jgi:hypothetical protein